MMENAEEPEKTGEDGEVLTVMLILLGDVGGSSHHNNSNNRNVGDV